ncbi:hypothetical protein ACFQVC_05925 [Streptomyces monticola]|uniref:Secreted protein n=1 Tax=Streptomyces monticola TaxID=2666263 RepID=A0ABW2JEE8_9ACTN
MGVLHQMTSGFQRLLTIACTASLALGGALVTGPQAQAQEQKCGGDTFLKEFDTPNENIDVEYAYCVTYENGVYNASGYGRVTDGGGARKVDSFVVRSRLEKNNHTVQSTRCNYTKAINNAETTNIDCDSSGAVGPGSFAGDGEIWVDLEGDGKGGRWYGVEGSAPMS